MPNYDVVIPAARKDFNKLAYVIDALKRNLNPQPDRVIVIYEGEHKPVADAICVPEFNAFGGMVLNPWEAFYFNRPPWILQQFIKLFQVVSADNYLVVDADLIINKPLDVFDANGLPRVFLGVDQNHLPYFNCSQDVFGFGRVYDHSFISEMMMFNRGATDNLLLRFHCAQTGKEIVPFDAAIRINPLDRAWLTKQLYRYICDRACEDWLPADYEIYGNYIEFVMPSVLEKVHLKTNLDGKYTEWNDSEIWEYLERMTAEDYDTFTLHTWV